MPRYLQKRRRLWYAILEIPKPLRKVFSKPRFVQSLNTDSQSLAEQRVLKVVAEWKRQIELARSGATHIESKVFKWRRLIDESRMEGLTEQEIEGVSLDVLDRDDPDAEQVHQIAFGKKHLLSEHIQIYIATRTTEQKSRDMARADIRRFSAKFRFAQDVTKKSLIRWVEEDLIGQQGLSTATCRRIISACRGYWAYLERHKELELLPPFSGVVPTANKKSKSDVRNKRKGFSPTDYRTLKNAVTESDPVLSDLITLGAYTGCRIEELCSLKLTFVTDDTIEIEDAKTEAGWRIIPIHSDLRQLVSRLRDTSTDGYLLSGLTFNKYGVRSNAIGKRFGRLKANCGYGRDYVFHSFRKGVATQLETANVSENIAARILGHDLKTMSYGLYSGGVSLEVLSEAIAHLSWE
ncbi:MAG: tyrosine-type recombinase/integrase [Paracoccaceae bacterium]|nr:tyrosine-type recombinase/integrase [Paracoccaceae bacterium]